MNDDPLNILDEEEDPLGLIQTPEEQSSSLLATIGRSTWGLAKRTAGVGIGIVNAPLAAVWGSQEAATQYEGPQWKRELVGLKGGLESAWRSISEKGDFGTLYGDYYKTVKGKTIEEDLPDNLKWAAPTLEVLANIVSDPLISFGEAGRIAQLKVPKGFIGKIPDKVVKQINQLEKAERGDLVLMRDRLKEALGNRADYMRWWEDEGIPEIMKREAIKRERDIVKQVPEEFIEQLKTVKPLEEISEVPDIGVIPKKFRAEPEILYKRKGRIIRPEEKLKPTGEVKLRKVEKPWEPFKSAEESAEVLARELEAAKSPKAREELLRRLRKEEGAEEILRAKLEKKPPIKKVEKPAKPTSEAKEEFKAPVNKLRTLTKKYPDIDIKVYGSVSRLKRPTPEEYVARKTMFGFPEKMKAKPDLDLFIDDPKIGGLISKIVDENINVAIAVKKNYRHAKALDDIITASGDVTFFKVGDNYYIKQKGLPFQITKQPKRIEILSKEPISAKNVLQKYDYPELGKVGKKPVPTTTLRATGGLVAGIEEDEQGNITYNIGKGTAGALLFAGGMKVVSAKNVKKFTQTLAKNPAWSKVHGMVGKERRSFELAGLWSKINTRFFDRFGAIKEKSQRAYDATRTFSAYKDEAGIKFDELRAGFSKVRDQEGLMSDYIDAHRAQTRAARGLKNPNNVTLGDANQAIKEIEAHYVAQGGKLTDLREARDSFKKWTHDYILKESLDSGMISEAAYADIVKNNKWYATFDVLDRMPENLHDIPALPSKEYFHVTNQNIIKKMVGTKKLIADPLEATVRKFAQAQATFARNKVASTLIDDPAMKPFLRPVAMSKKEFGIMKNQGLNPIMDGAWSKKEFSTINRFKDGKVDRHLVPIEIAESMKQLTPYQAPRVIKALGNIFRKSATSLYLPFTISNAMRDAFMAYTTSPVYKTPRIAKFGKDWTKGFWEGAKHEFLGSSDLAKTYIKSGGGFGYVGNLREGRLAKQALFKKGMIKTSGDIITSPFKLIEKISATIELAPRLGVFQRSRIMKIADADAALIARQSTIDFNRGGTWTKVVNQFVPFLNARVQGRVTLAAALKRDPKGTASKVFLAAAIPGMAAYAWNRLYHSDLYDDIPEYVKQNYFTIITGSTIDKRTGKTVPKYFVISKGDVGQIAWNPIEFGLDKMWQKDSEKTGAFLVNYLSDLSPVEFARKGKISPSKAAGGLLPPIVKGFAEDWANLNLYTGYEVVPHYLRKNKPPELQYKEWTPEIYKKLGKTLNIAPLRLQNFASNVVAGYGREGLSPTSMLRGLTGRVIRTQGGEIENRAWTVIKDIEQGYIYTSAYAQEMVKNGNRKGALKLIRGWNKGVGKQIGDYNSAFEKHGFKDRGGLKGSYTFSAEKIRNILSTPKKKPFGLKRKLRK